VNYLKQIRLRWIPTVSFFPILYLLGWILSKPFALIPFLEDKDRLELLGTLFTFSLFLILLPSWAKLRWNQLKIWSALGFNFKDTKTFVKTFLKGFSIAVGLISCVLVPIFYGRWGHFVNPLGFIYLWNGVLLGLVVGFAEELIFRGWLFNEGKVLLGPTGGIHFQAILFSLSHIVGFIKSDLDLLELIFLLLGLFLLGLVLGLRRILDRGSISGCIGLHGGLVGLWFFINADLIDISRYTPTWLIGPGELSPNPIGSFTGICCLLVILFCYRTAFAIAARPCNGARNASSRGATP